jgi:hypothetical protein
MMFGQPIAAGVLGAGLTPVSIASSKPGRGGTKPGRGGTNATVSLLGDQLLVITKP